MLIVLNRARVKDQALISDAGGGIQTCKRDCTPNAALISDAGHVYARLALMVAHGREWGDANHIQSY